MKKTFLLKSLLLLCALIVGSGTMWAQTSETISADQFGFTSNTNLDGDNATLSATNFNLTFAKNDANNVPAYNSSSKEFRLYKAPNSGKNGGSITIASKSENTTFTKIEFNFSNLPTNYSFSEGSYDKNKNEWSGDATTSLTLTNTDLSGQLKIKSMKIYYETTSSYTITAESNDTDLGTVSLSGTTITASPKVGCRYATPAYTVAPDNSATVVQDGNTFTVTPTANTTVTINFEAIPTHTAKFSVNGTVTEPVSYEEGAAITFPANPADIDGKSFVGWTTAAIEGTTNTAPEFVTSATMGETDITFYAVFADVDGTSEDVSTTITATSDGVPSSYGTANTFTEYTIDGIKYKIQQMYKSGGKLQWRAAGNSSGTGTMYNTDSFQKINSIVLTYNSSDNGKNFTVNVGNSENPTSGTSITPTVNESVYTFDCSAGNYSYFVLTNGSGAGYLDEIVINYTTGSQTISGYCTTVAADTREEAGLGFVESTVIVEWYNAAQYTGQALTNPHSVSPITWTSSNEGVATVENGTVTVLALGETTIKASFDGDNDYKKGEASYTLTVQDTREEPTVTIHDTFITHTNVFEGTAAGKLTASVKYNDNTIEGATVTWSGDNDAVATINATSGSVDLVAAGTVTFTAAYAGNEDYKAKTATYEMTVTYSDPNAPGTVNNPYTVAEARAAIDAGTGVTEVYARGIVSEIVTPFNSQFGNITYNISEDGSTTSDQLQAYRGKGIGGANFTSADDIQVGDVVVVYGDLKKHEDTYEFAQNNQLVSLKRARIIVDQTSYEADAKYTGTDNGYVDVTIEFTPENVTMHGGNSQYAPDFNAVVTCDANGNPTTYDWLKFMIVVPEDNVGFFYFEDNNGAPRTAYLKFHGVDADGLDVYSELITITQDGVAINVDETEIDASNIQSKNISVTYKNFNPVADDFGVVYCDENGDELSGGYDWIEKIAQWIDPQIEGTATILFKFDLNTGSAPRTAYMKIYAMNGNDRVYSELITITQEVYVEPTKVSFYVNGGPIEYSYLEEGDPIVFPEVSNIDGMTFLGWTSNEINGTTDTAPEFVDVTSATMGTESINYYAVFALLVAPGTTSTVTDELTNTLIGVSGSSYSSWEGKKASSDAVYKGNSAGGNDAIQLRTNNSNSGIVTTTSGGKLKKVTVEWNGNTANDRTLDIYGKNTAYSAASDLYGTDTQGTKIGSIVCGKSTKLTISGDYTFIGLRSNSGAMYLDKITIEWETGTPNTYSDYCTTIPAMLTVTIAEACTDGSKYYGTFSSSSAFKVPANVTVSEIGINNGGTMNVQEYAGGAIVPANTGVMVSATTFGEHKLIISSEEGTSVLGADNRLRPTGDDNGITATAMAAADESCVFYRLTMHNDTKLGFWWGAAEGAAFAVGPNKAYLAVPASVAGARNGFAFGDDATGISQIENGKLKIENCYDLQGRKVSTPGKGLYIVNGKKVVIK